MVLVRSKTSSFTFRPPRDWSVAEWRYGRGLGSSAGRGVAGTRKGSRAAMGVIQGEMVVAKFLERNGPRGWDSQDWRSRADQSLRRPTPKMCWAALLMGMGAPRGLG